MGAIETFFLFQMKKYTVLQNRNQWQFLQWKGRFGLGQITGHLGRFGSDPQCSGGIQVHKPLWGRYPKGKQIQFWVEIYREKKLQYNSTSFSQKDINLMSKLPSTGFVLPWICWHLSRPSTPRYCPHFPPKFRASKRNGDFYEVQAEIRRRQIRHA